MSTALSPRTAILRVLELGDVPLAAELHREMLPDGFFVALGPRFLRSYHRSFVTSPAGIGLMADIDGHPAGFLVGTVDEATHYRHVVRRNRWRLGVQGLLSLAVRPGLAMHFVRTRAFRYLRGMVRLARPAPGASAVAAAPLKAGVLSHLAVHPADRGRGVGSLLVSAFADTARAQGTGTVRLFVARDNEAARAMYEALRWERGPERCDPDGRHWVQYSLALA